jgi:hypothetical protein
MAHHGQNAVPKSVYVAIDPSIALWPCPDWLYTPSSSSGLTTEYTKKWMSELGVTNYVAKDGLKKVALNDITVDTTMVIPEELKALIFDATYYADRYADLKRAFGYDEAKLYAHFLNHGIKEGRCASHYFDIKYYISQNSAKMADYCKGNCEKGMKHFLKYAYLESELTGGGANVAIEVTGNGPALDMVLDCMARFGRVALLGCTRDKNFTIDYYRKVHFPGITMVGAHTMARPDRESFSGYWTTRDDILAVKRLYQHGRICFSDMIQETHSPVECGEVYTRLANEKSFPLVQFDWRKL